MTSSNLLKAILSMDSYNRGYDAGIVFGDNAGSNNYSNDVQGTRLGSATILTNSSFLEDNNGNNNIDQAIGFYALAYDLDNDGQVDTISYRGTDDADDKTDIDVDNGWGMGTGGIAEPQGIMAVQFYKQVEDATTNTITLTGHSMGGGFAGYIGALYDKDATIFDGMAFEFATEETYQRALNENKEYKVSYREVGGGIIIIDYLNQSEVDALQSRSDIIGLSIEANDLGTTYSDLLYDGNAPTVEPDLNGINGYAVEGESLGFNRWIQNTKVETLPVNADLGDNTIIPDLWPTSEEAKNRHSQSLLVIRLFAEEGYVKNNLQNWTYAQQYLWPNLFDLDENGNKTSFAESIGFKGASTGDLEDADDYAGVLRMMIAYSALESGSTNEALPFGKTAIRALYNDANDLGKAINEAADNSLVEIIATDISKLYVHFAGQLALKGIERNIETSDQVQGVLTYDQGLMTINMNEDDWTSLLDNKSDHNLVLSKVALHEAILDNLLYKDVIEEAVSEHWGMSVHTGIDTVILNTTTNMATVLLDDLETTGQAIYISGVLGDIVTGTNENDLIVAQGGVPLYYGEGGDDILIGSAVGGEYYGGSGNDYIIGGSDVDIIDGGDNDDVIYAGDGENLITGGAGVDHIYGGNDVDVIIGGDGNDKLYGGKGGDTYIFRPGEGSNTIKDIKGSDTLEFEGGIDKDDIKFEFIGCTLVVHASGTTIRINNQKEGSSSAIEHYKVDGDTYAMEYCEEDDEDQDSDSIGPIMPLFENMPMFTISPLVFDLDGDGVELTEKGIYNTYFDLRGNGQAVLTGWVAPDDGLLALDVNGDGVINDIHELFGNQTTDGFSVLRNYDSNEDGIINVQDTVFDDLLIWQDINIDGLSQADELKSLTDWGIASISLNATRVSDEIAGNDVTHEGTYTMTNGQAHEVLDVWFVYDTRYTQNNADYDLDYRVVSMPILKGFGEIKDMHIALSLDNDETDPNSLMSLMLDFNDGRTIVDYLSNWAVTKNEVRDILLRWAGVDGVDLTSRGGNVDARHLEFFEAFNGFGFRALFSGSNPYSNAGRHVEKIFDYIVEHSMIQIIGQSGTNKIFEDAYYSLAQAGIAGNLTLKQTIVDAISSQASDDVWANFAQFLVYTKGTSGFTGPELEMLNNAVADSNVFGLENWSDVLDLRLSRYGFIVNEPKDWKHWDETENNEGFIYGTDNDDSLEGTNTDLDVFFGYRGDDIYRYTGGGDIFTEENGGGFDQIIFDSPANFTAANVSSLSVEYDDLSIYLSKVDENGQIIRDTIYINDYFKPNHKIEQLVFSSDNSVINIEDYSKWNYIIHTGDGKFIINEDNPNKEYQILDQGGNNYIEINGSKADISAQSGYDTIKGSEYDDYIYTYGEQSDLIYGNDGDDEITSSSSYGNDVIFGGAGNDIIINQYGFNTIHGDDGDDYINATGKMFGDKGNDTLESHKPKSTNDHLTGGLGSDRLIGYGGGDHYYWSVGDGNDKIIEGGLGTPTPLVGIVRGVGEDILHIGSGLTSENIRLEGGATSLKVHIGNEYLFLADHLTSLGYPDKNNDGEAINHHIEKIVFDNGSVVDLSNNLLLEGTVNNEFMRGSSVNDIFKPYAGDDYIYAFEGNDTIYSGAGSKLIDGGEGHDTVIYENKYSIYSIKHVEGEIRVNQLHSSYEDTITGIEALHFNDGIYDVETETFTPSGVTNQSPTAYDDLFTTDEDVAVSGNVLEDNGNGADSDADGDSLNVVAGTYVTSEGGSVVVSSDGDFSYTPAVGYFGSDSFNYTLEDGQGGTDTATVNITVNEVVDTGEVGLLIDGVTEASSLGTGAASLLNGLDAITISAKVTADSIGHDKGVFDTETPDNGDDALTLRYDKDGDWGGGTNVIKAALNTTDGQLIVETESNVQVLGEQYITMTWQTGGDLKIYMDGVEVGILSTKGPKGGVITGVEDLLIGSGPKGGSWPGTIDDIKIFGYALTAQEVANLVGVGDINQAPTAYDDLFTTDEDVAVSGNVLEDNGNGADIDPDGDSLQASIVVNNLQQFAASTLSGGRGGATGVTFTENGGEVWMSTNGNFSYTPAAGYFGSDSFDYTLRDGQGGTDTATVNILVNEVVDTGEGSEPDAPVDNIAFHMEDTIGTSSLSNDSLINTGGYLQKTHSMAFETGADTSTLQILYEQGGNSRGLNMYIVNDQLYASIWNTREENWGVKLLGSSIEAGTKYVATMVMDGSVPANGDVKLYLNGELVQTETGVGKLYGHNGEIGIGEDKGGTKITNANEGSAVPFTGVINEIIQYNDALSGSALGQLEGHMAYDWLSPNLGSESAENIVFNAADFVSYNDGQDSNGTFVTANNGEELIISGNTWKKMAFDYTVTEDTVIEFDYKSTIQGELQGFVLETDNNFATGSKVIHLYGTDSNSYFDQSYRYNGSGEWQSFTIKASDYLTGTVNSLAFVSDHDDGNKNANNFYRNFRVYEQGGESSQFNVISLTASSDINSLNLLDYSFSDYGGGQTDNVINFGVNNTSVILEGNLWQKMDIGTYNVTADTVLDFDYRSTDQGEISGIGFDDNDSLDPSQVIQLGGSQSGWADYQDNYDQMGSWQSYNISLGDLVNGDINYLTFISDHDVSSPTAQAEFANIKLYESLPYVGTSGADLFEIDGLPNSGEQYQIEGFDVVNDVIDISGILSSYDPLTDVLTDFVQITEDETDSIVAVVDSDGADNFVQIATLRDITGLTDEDALVTSGNLIV